MNISKISGVNFGKLIVKPEANDSFGKSITDPNVARHIILALAKIDEKSGDTDVFLTTTTNVTNKHTEYNAQIHSKDGKLIAQEKFHADYVNPKLLGINDNGFISPVNAFDSLANSVEDYFEPNAKNGGIRACVHKIINKILK